MAAQETGLNSRTREQKMESRREADLNARMLPAILQTLSQKRPIFHSEADFQHALAWEIHEQFPEAAVRLENWAPGLGNNKRMDLWVRLAEKVLAVELKYGTRKLEAEVEGEFYSLKNQAAQDLFRYDFAKDMMRVE